MRARSIKPGLLANEVLGTADPLYTILFEALWMMADREGRLEDRPLRIKAQAFPYRNCDCDPMLHWLAEHRFITRYVVDGQRFIQVLKFGEHQHPHVKEPASKIPAPDSPGASPVPAPDKHQTDTSPARLTPSSLTPDSGLRTADSSSLRSPSVPQERDDGPVERVFAHWRTEFAHPRAQMDPKRRKVIAAALASHGEAAVLAAISGYKLSPHHMGQNDRQTVYDDIGLFLRDAQHIEAGINFARGPPRQLSAVDRVKQKMAARNGNGDGRVVSEQYGGEGGSGVVPFGGMLRRIPDS